MNKIVLITTEGCEGCSIMRYSINSALLYSSKEIEFEVKDVSEINGAERHKLKLTDFPDCFIDGFNPQYAVNSFILSNLFILFNNKLKSL